MVAQLEREACRNPKALAVLRSACVWRSGQTKTSAGRDLFF
jgi:hypothetical protein